MKNRFSKPLRSVLTGFMIASFTVFAFGQASEIAGVDGRIDPVRAIGWIMIVVAAVTHTAMNVYNMIRGKNYEQLKEAMNNYKELAESRKVVIADLHAEVAVVRQDNSRLEFENERLAEQVLRK